MGFSAAYPLRGEQCPVASGQWSVPSPESRIPTREESGGEGSSDCRRSAADCPPTTDHWPLTRLQYSRKGGKTQRKKEAIKSRKNTLVGDARSRGRIAVSPLCGLAPLREALWRLRLSRAGQARRCCLGLAGTAGRASSGTRRYDVRGERRGERGECARVAEAGKLPPGPWPLTPDPRPLTPAPWPLPPGPLPSPLSSLPSPRAFTLIEMLVVVTIMMILVAAAATRMRPATESRRIREAARALNVYISTARNRAMETGRPCGVVLHHFGATTAVMNLDQCEVPPSFSGGQTTSVATVTYPGTGNVITLNFYTDSGLLTPDPPTGLVRPGDLIQLNCQGPMYTVSTANPVDSNGYVTGATIAAWFDNTQGQIVPWNSAAPTTVTYQIFRSPTMNKSAATPLQLPASTVIDNGASGVDGGAFFGATDVAILFSPNGSVYGYSVAGAAGLGHPADLPPGGQTGAHSAARLRC